MGRENLLEGKVVAVLNLEGYSFEHYVIEVDTHIDPVLEVRNGHTISDCAEGPLGLWRKREPVDLNQVFPSRLGKEV